MLKIQKGLLMPSRIARVVIDQRDAGSRSLKEPVVKIANAMTRRTLGVERFTDEKEDLLRNLKSRCKVKVKVRWRAKAE